MAESVDCPSCAAARTNALSGAYHASCRACQVRALATGLPFFLSRDAGTMTQGYRDALRSVFGADGVKDGHAAVKAEWERIAALRGA